MTDVCSEFKRPLSKVFPQYAIYNLPNIEFKTNGCPIAYDKEEIQSKHDKYGIRIFYTWKGTDIEGRQLNSYKDRFLYLRSCNVKSLFGSILPGFVNPESPDSI